MCARLKEPFIYHNRQDFHQNLVDWIGDVLYDLLPDHGYEVRDEQIYTAFQIADAMCDKKVHLAEAGLGTGKTFAYLLSAIPYARFSKKPVVIACATTALQEQLASENGDIKRLSKLLDLEIDARMAKDPHEYICDVKVEENGEWLEDDLKQWINKTKRGERSEMPMISDHDWRQIGWDETMACDMCLNRGYCKLVKAREHYRATVDLIIVDHETYFYDLWTREDRIQNGKLPVLPAHSAVVFDEGHKILLPAAMKAGQQINPDEMDQMIFSLGEIQHTRNSFALITVALEDSYHEFFALLDKSVISGQSAERLSIKMSEPLLAAGKKFKKALDDLLLELQIEQGLYMESLTPNQIQAFEGQIERATMALNLFLKNNSADMIAWVDADSQSFWVVPRKIGEMLEKSLYKKDIPVIFTSATLSNEGDFDYFKRSIGLKDNSKSSIGSPFDLENQVVVYMNESKKEDTFADKIKTLACLIEKNGGRTLILANSLDEVAKIRSGLSAYELPYTMLYEDMGDRGYLITKFKEEETSVLVGAHFWEGIDVPGDALTMVVVWEFPFPALDPLLEAQRKEVKEQGLDPVVTVDYPEMGLKLKQGCGRLIRTEQDKGAIVILKNCIGMPYEQIVKGALPKEAEIKSLAEF